MSEVDKLPDGYYGENIEDGKIEYLSELEKLKMASCEKCWNDSYLRERENPYKDSVEHYHDLLEERKDNPCTPEQQAGTDAGYCLKCKRQTIHQQVRKCVICGIEIKKVL